MTTPRRAVEGLVGVASERIDVLGLPQAPAWTADALCAEVDLDGFFGDNGKGSAEAKKICGRCPVTAKCLEYALEHESSGEQRSYGPFGIYGGKSPRERRTMLREREAEAATS